MAVTSFSRLGSANAYDNTIANLETRQNIMSNLQQSLSSGKKINTPADDPTGAAQAERALNRLSRIATDQRALEVQKNAIATAESTLGDITSALQDARDLMSSAGNGSFSAAERKTVADQISAIRERILTLSNVQDSNGQPLFAALGSALKPFTGPASALPDYTFQGLPGTAATGTYAINSSLDGDSAFMLQPARDAVYNVTLANGAVQPNLTTDNVTMTNPSLVNGSSYGVTVTSFDPTTNTVTYDVNETPPGGTPGLISSGSATWSQAGGFAVAGMPGLSLNIKGTPTAGDTATITPNSSVFGTLDAAVNGLLNASDSNAASQAVGQALHNIDVSMARVSAVRGQAGNLLNRADSITSANDARNIEQEANRSRAEDIDMIKAVSQFQTQQTGYSAALQSYAQIQKLSLFNFIS